MTSIVVIASSTRRPRAMIKAPSEMRWKINPKPFHDRKDNREREWDRQRDHRAGAQAETTKLTAIIIAIACHSELINSLIAVLDNGGLIGHRAGSIPRANRRRSLPHSRFDIAAEVQFAALAHGDCESDGALSG